MPTPTTIPNSTQLFPLDLTAPAFMGLNTEASGTILGKEWATVLDNMVFDRTGRPGSRKGWNSVTSTAVTGVVKRVFEYWKADGTSSVVFSTDDDIYETLSTPSSIDGTLTITDGNIKFANFNDKLIAFGIGTGGIPAVKTTGNFADITVSTGTAPTSGIGTAAFGRLWAVDTDGKTIRYSALLDETKWAVADGGGIIDMSNVWPAGQDSIVAIEEFAGDMIVFGRNNTVIMTDGQGSSLGIDPTVMYVSDTIPGQGAISQFAMTRAAGDLWVLTNNGVSTLRRDLTERTTPITNLTKRVSSNVVAWTDAESDPDDITMMYSPKQSMVLAVFPTSDKQVYFDVRAPMQDGTFRLTTWTSPLQTASYNRDANTVYGSLTTTVGEIMEHLGSDDDEESYSVDYESGWLDLGSELNVFLKFVKRLTSFVFVQQNVTITHKIAYDFGQNQFAIQRSAVGGRVAEWGNAEWGDNGVYDVNDTDAVAGTDVAEWSGAVSLATMAAPGKGSGQYIKVGIRLDTNSGEFSLQQINLYAKVGRLAT